MEKIINKIAQELNVKSTQVENAVKLIDDGNTIPFIARYRKEATGGLSDEILRDLGERLNYLRNLETRKGEVVNSINEQGKLTDELTIAIASAETLAEVEDLYRPFKQKKKTRATVAKAKGLEPLADIIIAQEEKKDINEIAQEFVNIDNLSDEDKNNKDKVVATAEDAIQGALDIIAENISDNAKYRKYIKKICYREGTIVTKAAKPDEKSNYEMYYEFAELVHKLPSHRILAINRGEAEDFLKVSIEKPTDKILYYIQKAFLNRGDRAFSDNIEAWQFGPVVPNVYDHYCGYGAMPISFSIKYDVAKEDKQLIDSIVESKRVLAPWDLVEETHKKGGAWDKTYKNGSGSHEVIPTELIKAVG